MAAMRRGLLLLLAVTACGTLSPAAQRIKMVSKPETRDCRFLSVVYGGKASHDLFPKNTALETAASMGATHAVELYDSGGKYTADAYNCNESAAVAKAPPVAPPVESPADPEPAVVEASTSISVPPSSASSHADWVVAVMNVESKATSLDDQLLVNVGSQLRITIATKGIRTIDRGAIDGQIKEMKGQSYEACYDDQCQIELGKALAASHILRTQVTRFGRVCVLNGELIDLRAEVTVGAASAKGNCTDEGFLTMIDRVAQDLVGRS